MIAFGALDGIGASAQLELPASGKPDLALAAKTHGRANGTVAATDARGTSRTYAPI
jgi:hypothetical protein